MPFHSYAFLLAFLPLTVAGYFALGRFGWMTARKLWLIGASLVFYATFLIWHVPVLVLSVLMNYALCLWIRKSEKTAARCVAFWIGLTVNLGILFYYKYTNFFLSNVHALLGTPFSALRILLPVGISFFTFQQIAFLIDHYAGDRPPCSLLDYGMFVIFFPHLLAGPIPLHTETLPQMQDPANCRFDAQNFTVGVYAFARGLAKKVLVADVFAQVVQYGFAEGARLNAPEAWLVAVAYAMELYFDFSGYCDMGLGAARMLNIRLPLNFNSPYKAQNIKDFWARWHMTLTRFFQAYVHVPFVLSGKNRGSRGRMLAGILLVFLLSGIWHGAGWLFVLWGLMHGVAMVCHNLFKKRLRRLPPAAGWALTFVFVTVTLVFFRAPNLGVARNVLGGMFSLRWGPIAEGILSVFTFSFVLPVGVQYAATVAWLALTFACVLGMRNTQEIMKGFQPTLVRGVAIVLMLFFSILSLSGVSTFIYINF